MVTIRKVVIAVFSLFLFSGCYVLKQGLYLLHYTTGAEKIDKVLKDPNLPENSKKLLLMVGDIKSFASEMGLTDNKNYTRYVSIDQNYLVDVVTACKDDSFTPFIWKFPIVGKVPYKGFYQRKDADRLGDKLRQEDYDVMIRKVDGFSTLGFFSDPVYSFMASYSPYSLASLIFHEQTHSTIFVKNQIQFNEELATFVGLEGGIAYITSRYGNSVELRKNIDDYKNDQARFFKMIHDLHDTLNKLYTSGKEREYVLQEKKKIIADFKKDFNENYAKYFNTDGYKSIPGEDINNAFILSWNRYTRDLSLFYDLFDRYGGNFEKFMEAIKPVEKWKGSPEDYVKNLTKRGK